MGDKDKPLPKFPFHLKIGGHTEIWIKNERGLIEAMDYLDFLQEQIENRDANDELEEGREG